GLVASERRRQCRRRRWRGWWTYGNAAMQNLGFLANPSFTLRSLFVARQPRASLPATIASLPVHACAGTCPAARLCPPAPTLPLMASALAVQVEARSTILQTALVVWSAAISAQGTAELVR